ncbi:MAG: DUF362 domain-containing protein [Candidatus Eisenbacteria bacterium]
MNRPTRREFLRTAAALGGGVALAPYASWAAEDGAAANPGMSIIRWGGDPVEDPGVDAMAERLTRRALGDLGGMGRFVGRGDVVWIKPNIGWNRAPELGATTNPGVVAALVKMCLDAGAKKVKVGDHTCHDARQSYRSSGIEAAAKEAGADVVQLDDNRYREMKIGGERLDKWPLYPEIVETDLVISVPIVKHHGLSKATLCMKNYMGVIGGNRGSWHQDLPACLVDITAFMKPRLTVLDAVRVLTAHGPQGGNPADVERRNTVAAGTDIVALDAFGAELLGFGPSAITTIRAAEEAGLGTADYRSLAPSESAES